MTSNGKVPGDEDENDLDVLDWFDQVIGDEFDGTGISGK
jgi:hypothetical protein